MQTASLHPEIVWQRVSPSRGAVEGPVLYQLLFNANGVPGTIPVFDTNPRHLANSPIIVNGDVVSIGPFSVNGGTGIVTFANGQAFPGLVNSVAAGNSFITIGGTGSNPTVSFNTLNGDGRYLTLNGGTMTGKISFAAGQTFPGSGSGTVTSVATGAGLTGGPITGSGTISIANAGVTNAMLANPSLTINGGSGISGGGTVGLGGILTLSNAGLLTLNASSPLIATAGQNPTLSLGTVPVALGGTGITTGPMASGQYLRSTAAGAINWGDIVAGDLPSLSGTYVDLASAQSIGGNKTFTGNATFNNAIAGNLTGSAGNALALGGNLASSFSTTAQNDARYLQLNGGTLTGSLNGTNALFNGGVFTGNLSGNTASFNGNTSFGGGLQLPAIQNATATGGFDSNVSDYIASSFNSAAGAAVSQRFRWQAEPAGNNTGTASGSLNLLFSAGSNPVAETGLSINSGGIITFAAGQTFPGGSGGTVTQVNTGTGLTGGPITTSGTISIAAGGVSNTMLANSSLTVSAGTGLTGGGAVALGGSTTLNLATPVSIANGGTGQTSFAAGLMRSNGSVLSTAELLGDVTTSGSNVVSVKKVNGVTPGGSCTNQVVMSLSSSAVPTCASVSNAMLSNSSVTVNAGTGLSGGGAVALGGSTTLNLATPVSIPNGGTGITAGPTAAGQYLRSTGAGAINWGDIVAGDLPSLSGTYVDLASAQSIGGNKTFTGNETFNNTITGNISGNAATATTATSASTATTAATANNALALGGNAASAYNTTAQNDARYLQLTGGTLSGSLSGITATFSGNVAGSDASFTGGVFSGSLTGNTASFSGLLTESGGSLMAATGIATAAKGFNSNATQFAASSFSSTAGAAVPETFTWQAEPAGNNTSSPSGTLNLLFASGGTPAAETGLSIGSDGKITFATGQTFPGFVTSVAAANATITIGGTASAPAVSVGTIGAGNIAAGQVVKGLNGQTDAVTLAASNGLSVNQSAGTVTVASNATANNTANDIVSRDASGNFSAGAITLGGDLNLPNTTSASLGVINFGGVPFIHDFGASNTFVGASAGNMSASMTGGQNVGVGGFALQADTTGGNNSAFGFDTLKVDTTGFQNSAFGEGALQSNVSGSFNSAVGWAALNSNNGCCNSAFGAQTLQNNTTGTNNGAFGGAALFSNTTGSSNSALGDSALKQNTTGNSNSAFGNFALLNNTTASNNAAFGANALGSNTINSGNSAFGTGALQNNNDSTTAGNASNNSAFGFGALNANTTAGSNSAFGASALQSNSTGAGNSAFGNAAMAANTTASFSSAFGYLALNASTGSFNNAFGSQTLQQNTTGGLNDAFGGAALTSNTTGSSNSAFGDRVLGSNTSGGDNSAFGTSALSALATGSNNIAVGFSSGSNFTGSESNNIDIGNGGTAGESNVIRIGNAQTGTFIAGIFSESVNPIGEVQVFVDGSGKLGTVSSSRRYKQEITDMAGDSDVLMRLRPVSFYYKPEYDPDHVRQYGLVAEEVAEVAPGLVIFGKDGKPQTVRYHLVNAMLLNELQKSRKLIEVQAHEIDKLSATLQTVQAEQRSEVEALRAEVKALRGLIQQSGKASVARVEDPK